MYIPNSRQELEEILADLELYSAHEGLGTVCEAISDAGFLLAMAKATDKSATEKSRIPGTPLH